MLEVWQDSPVKVFYFLIPLESGRKQFDCVFEFLTIMKSKRHEVCGLSENNELVK